MRRSTTLQKSLDVSLGSLKPEGHVSAFSCDVTGRYAVLADSQGLAIMDLEYPYQKPRLLHHQTKAKVLCVRYNPHFSRKDHVVSTSHSHALIWRVDDDYRPLVAGLRKHTRPIKDVGWSPHSPDVVCSGGMDGMLYLWDLRAPATPCQAFSAGPNKPPVLQLSWNRQNPSLLACGHDGEVCIWDSRRAGCTTPLRGFAVPGGPLRSLDWSHVADSEIVTCGGDAFVRFWDVSSTDHGDADPSSHQQVPGSEGGGGSVTELLSLRAVSDVVDLVRYAPFGQCGLVSVGKLRGYQPQQMEGRHDTLYLWALPPAKNKSAESLQQVCRFEGHAAPVVSYDWRVVEGGLVYQLVSLDEAQQLRLWRVDAGLLRACGHVSRPEVVTFAPDADDTALLHADAPAPTPQRSGGYYDTISPGLAAKLSADALKLDLLHPATAASSSSSSASQPMRPAPTTSTHTAVSVWQEMVEVEELARQGGLRDVDIEMVDVMSRTMRLSVGPLRDQRRTSPSLASSGAKATSPPSPQQQPRAQFRILVTVEFPPSYPYGATPKFTFRAVREEDDEDEEEDEDEDDDERGVGVDEEGGEGGRGREEKGAHKRRGKAGKRDEGGEWEEDEEEEGAESESPTREGRGYSSSSRRRKTPSGGGLLSQAGRELLSREVGDVARAALEAQVPCLESCIRHLEKTLGEAAAAGVPLLTTQSSGGEAGGEGATGAAAQQQAEDGRLQFAIEGAGGEAGGEARPAARGLDGQRTPSTTSMTGRAQGASQLPCPRYGGGVFSGPNMLVLFNCTLTRRGSRTASAGGGGGARHKPPRTYGNLLRRASGSKGYGSESLGSVPRGLSDYDPSERQHGSSSMPHSRRSFSSAASSSSGGSSLARTLSPDMASMRRGAGGGGAGQGEAGAAELPPSSSSSSMVGSGREGGGSAARGLSSPVYSLYFMSPQSRLPLNHPDHDYSFQEPHLSRLGLPMGLSPDDEGLAAAALAQLNTQVLLLDASRLMPGSPRLAALYSLGPCRSTASLQQRMPASSTSRWSASRRSPAIPMPHLPARRVSEPTIPRTPSAGTLAGTSVDTVGSHSTTPQALSVSPSAQSFLRRLAGEGQAKLSGGGARPLSERLGNKLSLAVDSSGRDGVTSATSSVSGGPGIVTTVTPTPSLRRYNSLVTERDTAADSSSSAPRPARRPLPTDASQQQQQAVWSAYGVIDDAYPPARLPPAFSLRQQQQQHQQAAVGAEEWWWRAQVSEARAISKACRANARAAAKVGDRELLQVWMLLHASTAACAQDLQQEAAAAAKAGMSRKESASLAMMLLTAAMVGVEASEADGEAAAGRGGGSRATRAWKKGALGRSLVDRLLKHYERLGDVQTLATIVCVLNAAHPDTLLQESKRQEYDRYLHCYAELLFRWGALDLRADVLKRVSRTHTGNSFSPLDSMGFALRCNGCGQSVMELQNVCDKCNTHPMKCVVCELAVKGQSMFCLACSHGGHTQHMQEWFSTYNVCPSGCGCRCLFSQSVHQHHLLVPRGPSPGPGDAFLGPLASQTGDEALMI